MKPLTENAKAGCNTPQKDDYIWCPKSAAPKGSANAEYGNALKLIRKNPRACRENCSKRHKCKPYQNYWQYDLFDFLAGKK